MNPATASTASSTAIVFEDGLGQRRLSASASNETLELLALREELTAVPSFEFALRDRVNRLSSLQSEHYARVRGVERVETPVRTLVVVSEHVPGRRLSEILADAESRLLPIETNAALGLIRQLVQALALLHQRLPDVCHGAVGPERLIVTPDARLVLVEPVLGAALDRLQYTHEQYWKTLRIALPRTGSAPQFDRRADIMQAGLTALALIIGRPIAADEYPARIGEMTSGTWALSALGTIEPLPVALREWLMRALQFETRHAFPSALEAWTELERALHNSDAIAEVAALRSFMARYHERVTAGDPSPATLAPAPAHVTATRLDARVVSAVTMPAEGEQALDGRLFAEAEPPVEKSPSFTRGRWIAAAIVLVALTSGGTLAVGRIMSPAAAPERLGTLSVQTSPAGATVVVDGRQRGMTPLSVQLKPGRHLVDLVTDGNVRSMPVTITPGGEVSQFIEIPRSASARDEQRVATDAGTTALRVVSTTPTKAPASGWIAVSAPVELQIYENQRLLGSSQSDRLMMPVGRHELEIVNDALAYRATKTVIVSPGETATVTLELPKAPMALNAIPWAEAWVDGERVGETPIGGVQVTIGSHEVMFRHPELGERRVVTTVSLAGAKVSVDMRKQ